MPAIFNRNERPAYYSLPAAFRATVGAAAITAFPASTAMCGVQASATMAFSAQPNVNSTITINGVQITFVAAGAASPGFSLRGQALSGTILSSSGVPLPYQAVGQFGLQCEISAAGLYATLLNLIGLCRSWPDENLAQVHLRLRGGNTIQVSASATGTGGNAIPIAASAGANVTLTGATTVANNVAGNTTLTGGAAPAAGYAVLVEPQPHPVEISAAWGICRASQAAGSVTLFESDGTVLSKVDAVTFAAGSTLSATQELSRIPFSNIAAATVLELAPWTGLYAYGSTTQVVDLTASGGVY
jgi:hypothetical protein